MGTYTTLSVADYDLFWSKSEVIPELMTVFRETDRRTYNKRLSEQKVSNPKESDIDESDDIELITEYACETRYIIDRLNVMGFSLSRARNEFESGRLAKLKEYESRAAEDSDSSWYKDEWDFLKLLTFDGYIAALKTVIAKGLRADPFDDGKMPGLEPTVKYILQQHDEELFGFFAKDIRCLLRVACEVVSPDSYVIQNISGLIDAGYYDANMPVCEITTRALVAGHPENSPRIILTEGSSDSLFLKQAMALLFPHLVDYYSFLDFDTSRSPGGAGHLVGIVKAFSAAGITNRIIALFDNDTAAKDAIRMLHQIQLSSNITIQQYPEMGLLRNYPTLGPNGLTNQDVNGLAASIELYFGEDILRDDSGALTPVQWKGYNETLGQYQGEVMRKSQLQEAFAKKVGICQAKPEEIAKQDWSGFKEILNQVFRAFD